MTAIKIYLQPSPSKTAPNTYCARVIPHNVLDIEKVIQKMLDRGTMVTKTDTLAVLDLFFEIVIDEVAEGNHVNLPIANLRPSITGKFTSMSDSFDPARHKRRASASPGKTLLKRIEQAKVQKTRQPLPRPEVLVYQDTNTTLTAGGIGQIVGYQLKFNPDNSQEGLFLINEVGLTTKITAFTGLTDTQVVVNIPALPAGKYYLEVRRGYTDRGQLRVGRLNNVLQILS